MRECELQAGCELRADSATGQNQICRGISKSAILLSLLWIPHTTSQNTVPLQNAPKKANLLNRQEYLWNREQFVESTSK